MQRINVSVDLSNNLILPEEIKRAIQGAVKAKTREFFNKSIEEELQRVANNTLRKWHDRTQWNESPLEKEVKKQIDTQVREQIGNLSVSKSDIERRIEEKIKNIGESIDYAVGLRVDRLPIKDYIAERIAVEVRKSYPEKIIKLIEKQDAEELQKRIKELEEENARLRTSMSYMTSPNAIGNRQEMGG